jgi:hypothetical protein
VAARASAKGAKLKKVAETMIAGEGSGEKFRDSARRQGSARVFEIDFVTSMEKPLQAKK